MRRTKLALSALVVGGLAVTTAACAGTAAEDGALQDAGGTQGGVEEATAAPAAQDGGQWSDAAPLPEPRSETAVTQTEDAMYVLGGYDSASKASVLNSAYDPQEDSWTDLAPLPEGLNHIATAAAGGKVYAFGGFTDQNEGAVDSAYEYDPAADAWTELPPMPTPRGSAAAFAVGGRLHVVGGADDTSGLRENVGAHEIYDPATGQWTEAAPLPTPREHMPAVVYDGRVHVIGGRFLDMSDNTGAHEVYDPATDSWEEAAPLPTPRSGSAAAVLGDRIVVMGGEMDPESASGTFEENEAYDPASDSWTNLAPLPTPRHGFGAAVFDGALYTPGGAPTNGGGQQSGVNEVFTLS